MNNLPVVAAKLLKTFDEDNWTLAHMLRVYDKNRRRIDYYHELFEELTKGEGNV